MNTRTHIYQQHVKLFLILLLNMTPLLKSTLPSITTITAHVESSPTFDMDSLIEIDEDVFDKEVKRNTKKSTMIVARIPMKVCDRPVHYRVRAKHYMKKNGKWHKNFHNCHVFTIRVDNGKKRTIKYFKNGIMHVTGCRSMDEISTMCSSFLENFAKMVDNADVPKIKNVNASMVNATCRVVSLAEELDLADVNERLESCGKFVTTIYDRQRYFGIKLSCAEPSYKCNIFRTGSITLTGMTKEEQIQPAYEHIIKTLTEVLPAGIQTLSAEDQERDDLAALLDECFTESEVDTDLSADVNPSPSLHGCDSPQTCADTNDAGRALAMSLW